jgi:hypothetical protein
MTERTGSHGPAFWREEFPLMVAWAFARWASGRGSGMSSVVAEDLQYAPPERSFQLAVDVQSERFEPRPCPVARPWNAPFD